VVSGWGLYSLLTAHSSLLIARRSSLEPVVDNSLFFPDSGLLLDCNSLSVNAFFCDAIADYLVDRMLINVEGVN
jgi:hypothetical protein